MNVALSAFGLFCVLGFDEAADRELAHARTALSQYTATLQTCWGEVEHTYVRTDRTTPDRQTHKWWVAGGAVRLLETTRDGTDYFYCFDGQVQTNLTFIKDWIPNVRVAKASTTHYFADVTPLTLAGVWLASPTPTRLADAVRSPSLKTHRLVDVDKRRVLELELSVDLGKGTTQRQRYRLDPTYGYLPYEIAFMADKGEPTSYVVTEYREIDDPKSGKRRFPAAAERRGVTVSKYSMTVREVHVNGRLDPKLFRPDFPDGADVFDDVNKRQYIQGGNHHLKKRTELFARREREKQAKIAAENTYGLQAPSAAPNAEGGPWWIVGLVASVGLLALAGVLARR